MYSIIILSLFGVLLIFFNIYLYLLFLKINKLEKIIIKLFIKRSDLIPSLFSITKNYITKHDIVFLEILKLRKRQVYFMEESFFEKIQNEINIHNELNFIFTLLNKNYKISKNGKFLLIRDLFLEHSAKIGGKIKIYKNIITIYNRLLKYKNFTIIGLFFPMDEKIMI